MSWGGRTLCRAGCCGSVGAVGLAVLSPGGPAGPATAVVGEILCLLYLRASWPFLVQWVDKRAVKYPCEIFFVANRVPIIRVSLAAGAKNASGQKGILGPNSSKGGAWRKPGSASPLVIKITNIRARHFYGSLWGAATFLREFVGGRDIFTGVCGGNAHFSINIIRLLWLIRFLSEI
jgi:hypothetical protein